MCIVDYISDEPREEWDKKGYITWVTQKPLAILTLQVWGEAQKSLVKNDLECFLPSGRLGKQVKYHRRGFSAGSEHFLKHPRP